MATNLAFVLSQDPAEHLGTLADTLQSANQDAVALAALVVGTILAVRGRAVIKFLFVFCFSLSITLWTCLAAKKDGHTGLGMVVASLVLPCAVMAADRLYLLFCFLVGGAVGGTLGYAFRGLISLPALAVGLLVVASLVSGLVFLRWRNLGWRLLLPPLGALLLGASLRYCFARVLLDGEAHWLDFAYAPWSDLQALASDALDVCFICASGVFTLLGWYLQFASLLGLDDPLALPEHIENLLEKTQEWLPVVFDGSMESAKPHAPAEVTEPFLGRKAERDTKPEVILFIAILTVLLLCGLLCSRPLLFLGHVVLMSCAFTPLMTAGLLSYSSRSSRQALHEHSGAVSLGLALLCALGGYACMYVENKLNETSHLGLSDDGDVAERTIRVLHVWLGYAILGILCILALIAPGMLRAGERSRSRSIATCQRVLGKMMYGLGMTTQILGYFIEGLLPSWASWLLTSSLLAVALATLAASEGPYSVRVSEEVSGSRDGYSPPAPAPAAVLGPTRAAPARAPEKQAPPVIPCVSIASTKIESGRSEHRTPAMTPRTPRQPPSTQPPEVRAKQEEPVLRRENSKDRLVGALIYNLRDRRRQAMLTVYFGRWQSSLLSNRLSRTSIEAAANNNLADFLSASLVVSPVEESLYQGKGVKPL